MISKTGRRWALRPADDARTARLIAELGLLPVVARIAAARGLEPAFFRPSATDLHASTEMAGMARAVDRIERAVAGKEHIRLVTDYDVDGTTSCLILHAAIERRGGSPSYHIPDRFIEGYGLSMRAVEQAAVDGVKLLITADIGVRDHTSIRAAREAGIDVIVCDHHLPAGESVPPDAYVVLCPPQEGCPYPNKALAACGVSFKVADALLRDDPRRTEVLRSMLKLAAIGTVADVVDLQNAENRAIVTLGLDALNTSTHAPGLTALLEVASVRVGEIDAGTLGWRLGPRINAAGRLADATAVVRLLRERSPDVARRLARELDNLNRERQDIQERLVEQVMERIPDPAPAFLVIAGEEEEGFHRGIVGIVASKVRERVNRPVAIVSMLGPNAVGSVRSVPAVHATRALDAVAPLLTRYGGHAAAAGFSLPRTGLPALQAQLAAWVEAHHGEEDLMVVEDVDAELTGADLTLPLARQLRALEPCGKGNPPARVVLRGRVDGIRVVSGKHLFARFGGADLVWWGAADRQELLSSATQVLGEVEIDRWNGVEKARLRVEDVT